MDGFAPDTFFDAVKSFSPAGPAELLTFFLATAIQISPQDGRTK
jgi:hypothetical protein